MIYIIARGYPSKESPFNGIFELDQARALKTYGQDIAFVALDFRSIRRWRKFGFFTTTEGGIKCFHVSFPLGSIEYPLFNYIARKITRLGTGLMEQRLGRPKIIHAHFAQVSSLAIEIKDKLKAPLIITEHNSSLNADFISPHLYAIAKKAYANANLVISVSASLRKSLETHFNIKSTVVSNVVDNSVFNYDIDQMNSGRGSDFILVSVGVLEFRKGFDLLVKALGRANFKVRVKLKIIGSGEQLDTLNQEVKELGIEDNVEFLGYQPREKIVEEFKRADAFILASRRETFGLVYVEALFCGLPVIATNCGGPEEFINKKNGILVPVNDEAKLADALSLIVENYHIYNKSEISENAVRQFSPHVIAERLSELYDQVLKRNEN